MGIKTILVPIEGEKTALERAADLQEQFQDFYTQYSVPLCEEPSGQAGATAGWQQEFGHVDECWFATDA